MKYQGGSFVVEKITTLLKILPYAATDIGFRVPVPACAGMAVGL